MNLAEHFRTAAVSRLAESALVAVAGAAGWIAHATVEYVLPSGATDALGSPLAAEIIVALVLIVVLLAAWIAYLRRPVPTALPAAEPEKPRREWTQLGFWKDLDDGLDYCAKCNVTPLHKKEAGWYCVTCHLLYDDPEFKRRQREESERKRREEDALVRRINSDNSWMA